MSKRKEAPKSETNFENEVYYRLAKWLLLNMKEEGILAEKQLSSAWKNILDSFEPPFRCLENLDGPIGDGMAVSPERRAKSILGSKIICGECGSRFGPRPWHSTSYNNIVWQCPGRVRKSEQKCMSYNIYDTALHCAGYEIAMNIIYKRGIEEGVEKAVAPLLPEDKKAKLHRWLANFRNRGIWGLQSDDDDLAIIIREIVVWGDGSAEAELIDKSFIKYQFPAFRPSCPYGIGQPQVKKRRSAVHDR